MTQEPLPREITFISKKYFAIALGFPVTQRNCHERSVTQIKVEAQWDVHSADEGSAADENLVCDIDICGFSDYYKFRERDAVFAGFDSARSDCRRCTLA